MKEHDFITRLNLTERERAISVDRDHTTRKGLVSYLLRVTAHEGDREGLVDIFVNKDRNPDGTFYMGTVEAGKGDEATATWIGRYELPK